MHVSAYPIIRQFGRYLDLEEDELNEVERFSEYGTKEAFWQAIRFWLEKRDSSELTVGTIIKALMECDVNLKGKSNIWVSKVFIYMTKCYAKIVVFGFLHNLSRTIILLFRVFSVISFWVNVSWLQKLFSWLQENKWALPIEKSWDQN